MNELNIRRLLSAALFLCLGLYVFIALRLALVNDDYMALYTTWLMSVGKVPNVDFAVSSYTLLFDLFAPVYYLVGEHFEILYVFRLLFLLMLSMLAWQVFIITRFFFTSTTALITLLLLATSSAMVARGLDIRPDLPIILLWLQTIIVLYIKRYKEATKMFWVGFLFILAMLFKFPRLDEP